MAAILELDEHLARNFKVISKLLQLLFWNVSILLHRFESVGS